MDGNLKLYGGMAGALLTIFTVVGFIGEPHLRDFIDVEIKLYDEAQKLLNSAKVSFRQLLGDKMGLPNDETHIEIGRQYLEQKKLVIKIDSLGAVIKRLDRKNNQLLKDINANYRDILKLQRIKKDK